MIAYITYRTNLSKDVLCAMLSDVEIKKNYEMSLYEGDGSKCECAPSAHAL